MMTDRDVAKIIFAMNPPLDEARLEELFLDAWGEAPPARYGHVLARSLAHVAAFQGERLVGFVNLAWDGGAHAFITDAMVRSDMRNRGIGLQLVRTAIARAREAGVRWIHADYEPHLDGFFAKAGFLPTRARVLHVGSSPWTDALRSLSPAAAP
jgi:GNAT superfamily N-acetyltransferase